MTAKYESWDKEQLVEEIKRLQSRKKYGLVWEDKPEEVAERCKNELPVLEEVVDRAIEGSDSDVTNLIIEGDNYHALSVLNYTHAGRVDVIYIDPPYNTESKDFRYNDKYIDKEDTFRHSKWLSFMHRRLKLANDLLKNDGAILISINENELFNLKLLCDEIFKPDNYLTCFTIKVRHEDRILKGDKDFHEVTEYLLMYRKSSRYNVVKRMQDNTSNEEYIYQIIEKNIDPEKLMMGNKEVSVFKPNEYDIVKIPSSINGLKKINIRGSIKEGNSSGRFYMAHIDELKNNYGYLYKVPNMGGDSLDCRYFQARVSDKKRNGNYFQGVPVARNDIKFVPYPNYFNFEPEFNNVGYEGGIEFRNGKKPLAFLKRFLSIASVKKEALILDFFAGSGSTGHAVMQLNKEDGGVRNFILCTNNENGIAEEVTYPRIKNVIEGYFDVEGVPANLRYFKTDFIKKTNVSDDTRRNLVKKSTEMICVKESTFKKSYDNQKFKIYHNSSSVTGILFDLDAVDEFKEKLEKANSPSSIYVFSLTNDVYDEDFADLRVKHTLKPIPEGILEVYRKIFA
ncbi:MAG: site-specific DNA-methyltransferase [Patescibacteria group bacterium]